MVVQNNIVINLNLWFGNEVTLVYIIITFSQVFLANVLFGLLFQTNRMLVTNGVLARGLTYSHRDLYFQFSSLIFSVNLLSYLSFAATLLFLNSCFRTKVNWGPIFGWFICLPVTSSSSSHITVSRFLCYIGFTYKT